MNTMRSPLYKLTLVLSLLALTLVSAGCATSLTTMTDARAYEPGEVQVAVAYQANLHSNIIGGAVRALKSADDEFDKNSDAPISEESFRSWLDLAIIGALFRPAMGPELLIRVGVTDDLLEGLDVGFKTDLNILKFDGKLQLWESLDGKHAVSTMLGYAYHMDVGNKILSYVTLTDFSRFDLDLQVLYGFRFGEWLKLTVSPHIILSRIKPESKIPEWLLSRLPEEVTKYDPGQFFETEWLQYYGLTTGLMLGYKYAYLATDLGMFYMNFQPTVVGQRRDFSGGAFSVALGISGHYAF